MTRRRAIILPEAMAYRQNDLGLLMRLSPKLARAKVVEAFKKIDDEEPGRVVEKAAKLLGVGPSTLKRMLEKFADLKMPVAYHRKRPAKKSA